MGRQLTGDIVEKPVGGVGTGPERSVGASP
jgi:hypothetical protein